MLQVSAKKERKRWTLGRVFYVPFPDDMPLAWRASLVAACFVQIVLVVKSEWLFRGEINPDAVAYIRIAQYYVSGQTDVMISGYWGPLLSWLIVPWLWVFDDPLLAAHAAMAVSAVVFLVGCFCVLRAVRLPGTPIMISTWITAFFSVAWSGAVITPDLLMAGLFCCGTSRLLSDTWVAHARTALGAGLVLGAAYLAKAVALPVSALMLMALAGTHVAVCQSSLRQTVRAATMVGVGFLLVAGPWIGMLSYKYGHPVFSTSGPISHAIVGPPDMPRDHPDQRHFYKPETGRITTWEDPTHLPYNYWSPLENVAYAVHQTRVIHRNAHVIVQHLKSFDWFGLGLVSAICGYVFGTPWRQALQTEPWRLSFIPIASLALIYLPVYAKDARYYWVAFPFLSAASFGFTLYVSGTLGKHRAVQRALALALVTLSLIIGHEGVFFQAFSLSASANSYYRAAKILAHKLKETDLIGPVAAVGPVHGAGLYLAYLSNVPSFGDIEKVDDPEEILSSGAALVIVPRDTALALQLREDPRFASVDKQLFSCDEAHENPLEVMIVVKILGHKEPLRASCKD
jgi:hypothetical protein